MYKLWIIIFFILPLVGMVYSLWHVWHILPIPNIYKYIVVGILAAVVCWFFGNFAIFNIDHWPMPLARASYQIGNSAIFILMYTVLIFIALDLAYLAHILPRSFLVDSWKGTLSVAAVLMAIFIYGYFQYRNKVRVPIKLQTNKTTGSVKKIVMLSDLHVGYHIDRKELSSWVDKINDENADLILIGGDIIDGRMRPLIEENMAEEFRRFNAPVYACIGNHEYYTGKKAAEKFYREANINLLIDQTVTVKGINIIGRDDRTNEKRCSLKDLTGHLDMRKFTILLDHQPYHLEQAEEAGIDFQLSGHTHYGQMWPINWIEDVIYEKAHGALTKGNTQYYISSGIGIWGAKFRLGTQSEYVAAQLPIAIKQNTAKNKRDRNAN